MKALEASATKPSDEVGLRAGAWGIFYFKISRATTGTSIISVPRRTV